MSHIQFEKLFIVVVYCIWLFTVHVLYSFKVMFKWRALLPTYISSEQLTTAPL